jgi:hypothetical protein
MGCHGLAADVFTGHHSAVLTQASTKHLTGLTQLLVSDPVCTVVSISARGTVLVCGTASIGNLTVDDAATSERGNAEERKQTCTHEVSGHFLISSRFSRVSMRPPGGGVASRLQHTLPRQGRRTAQWIDLQRKDPWAGLGGIERECKDSATTTTQGVTGSRSG